MTHTSLAILIFVWRKACEILHPPQTVDGPAKGYQSSYVESGLQEGTSWMWCVASTHYYVVYKAIAENSLPVSSTLPACSWQHCSEPLFG
jgi:hypothetical protein